MRLNLLLLLLFAPLAACSGLDDAAGPTEANPMLTEYNPMLTEYMAAREAEFDQIDADRRALLDGLAAELQSRVREGGAELTFICTHNSRRSHLGQIWMRMAAARFGLEGVETFSGGTEATAFNPRAIAALERAAFIIEPSTFGTNPVQVVQSGGLVPPMDCFSKKFTDEANPQSGFIAVMTCDDADEACPTVPGAQSRFAVTYRDPKEFDGTDREAAAYDERCAQIAREMLYVCSKAAD